MNPACLDCGVELGDRRSKRCCRCANSRPRVAVTVAKRRKAWDEATPSRRAGSKASWAEHTERKEYREDAVDEDRVYDADEIEFMMAMQKYKTQKRRPFPTWSEALEVLKALGYTKTPTPGE